MRPMIKRTIIAAVIALSAGMAFAAVTEDEAVAIALSDAGVRREDTSWLNSHRDRDDGRVYYDVEFRSDDGKWEYEIDSESGNIVGFDFEESRSRTAAQDGIDRAEAESIALSDAELSRDDVSRFRIESDRDDGMMIYEISFNTADSEYEYDIAAADGTVLKADWERRGRLGGDREARLSVEEAEDIALGYLGSDAERFSVWEDRDDGRWWYEAEAKVGDYRYEIDITGDGEIVSVSRELMMFR